MHGGGLRTGRGGNPRSDSRGLERRGEGLGGGLTPAQLAKAYEYSPTEGGAGQTIAVIDDDNDPNIEEDLGVFDKQYGLPECTTANGCFKKVSETGSTTALPPNVGTEALETTLDVETARAVCQTCKILLVEGNGALHVCERQRGRQAGRDGGLELLWRPRRTRR